MSKRHKRTVKKMVLPLAAVLLMILMMYIGRPTPPTPSFKAPNGAAARVPHDLRTR